MPVILKNNVDSVLAQAINASETAMVVATGEGIKFPALAAGEYFYATLVSAQGTREIVKVTGKSGDTLGIERAQEGTTANSFGPGSRVEMRVTAASITDLVDEHDQAAEISITDAGGYYTSDNVEGALQEVGGIFNPTGSSLVGYTQGDSGSVTRTVEAKLQEFVSVKDFGAVGDGVTDDTAAIQAALTASDNVYLPVGDYKITSSISVGEKQQLQGAGIETVIKSHVGSGQAAIVVGNPANNVLSYGCIVKDLTISPQVSSTIGVQMYSLVGAIFSQIEIQPYATDVDVTGFILDGGQSAFFNLFQNILCNHCHVGIKITTTGASYPTCQTFVNFSCFGDLVHGDTTSIGMLFENVGGSSCGNDSVIIGGNLEQCGTGISIVNFNSLTCTGLRFEFNTNDILAGTFTQNCNFISCKNIENVSGLVGQNGYGQNTFIGCNGTYGSVNRIEANNNFLSKGAAETPQTIKGYPLQTAALQQFRDSSNNIIAEMLPNGALSVSGASGTANSLTLRATSSSTVGAAGAASALPVNPLGYLVFDLSGTSIKIPYYTA